MMQKLDKSARVQHRNAIMGALAARDRLHFREMFLELHPADQLDVFITLNKEERQRVNRYISAEEMANIFEGLSFQKQKEFLWELDETYTSEMFHNMFIDDVVSFLTKLNESDGDVDFILDNMELGKAKEIEAMLAYEKETAGAVMTKELVSINPSYTVGEVLRILRKIAPGAEMVYYLFVID